MAGNADIIGKLADIQDIQRIKGLYCDLIDRIRREGKNTDVEHLASLFTEDAVLDFSSLGQGTPKGRVAIVEHFTKTLPSAVAWMWHSVHTPVIEINGDEATGRWTLLAMAVPIDNPSTPPFSVYGRYIDTFRRIGGVWYQSSLCFLNETR